MSLSHHFNPDYGLSWISTSGADTFGDIEIILPGNLLPLHHLNHCEANLLPQDLLHHNSVDLLCLYVTQSGQITERMQSRLGAKDQHKIAKLLNWARHLGLIPHMGQWKYKDHRKIFAK